MLHSICNQGIANSNYKIPIRMAKSGTPTIPKAGEDVEQ